MQAAPGDLIFNGKDCAHEFINKSADSYLAVLVVSSPPFNGNLYIRPDDKRASVCEKRDFARLTDIDPDVAGGSKDMSTKRLDLFQGRKTAVIQIAAGNNLDVKAGPAFAFFVVSGAGSLRSGEQEGVDLAASRLVIVRKGADAVIQAGKDAPLSILGIALSAQ